MRYIIQYMKYKKGVQGLIKLLNITLVLVYYCHQSTDLQEHRPLLPSTSNRA